MREILLAALIAFVTLPSARLTAQSRGVTGCSTNIVSSTVVATFCGHDAGGADTLDLFIVWRGQPGWFFQRSPGRFGSAGSGESTARGVRGRLSRSIYYGPVILRFDADFDTGSAFIEGVSIDLRKTNVVLVDKVDEPGPGNVSNTAWSEPRLPRIADTNLALIQRSPLLRDFIQCEIPMPASRGEPRPRIITVCEKLERRQR